ncbi:hypothetical protein GPJ81_04605 [Pseudomonas alkylphenolica]|uniref:XRE family transcriptional regulator n=1 Tax=Pseudomonas alkylphenolica TaxID=237609 RepID=A0A6I6GNU2_9PSED|nr:hypothetical protein [Pseudomonas alkylphenolica]QGW75980.1 hypothetical protein GPJ81_04605 [Pseudomonas alkylphenolica]
MVQGNHVGPARRRILPPGAADEIGIARTTLIGWRQGAEPRYSEGERLVLLWCKITGESRD